MDAPLKFSFPSTENPLSPNGTWRAHVPTDWKTVHQKLAPGEWEGVVRIERPAGTVLEPEAPCRVISARLAGLAGARAILVHLPWSFCRQWFQAGDLEFVSVHAELRHGHLNLLKRADPKDYFLHTLPN